MEYLQFISIWLLCTLLLACMVISLAMALFPVKREHGPDYRSDVAKSSERMLSKTGDRI